MKDTKDKIQEPWMTKKVQLGKKEAIRRVSRGHETSLASRVHYEQANHQGKVRSIQGQRKKFKYGARGGSSGP